MVHWLAICCLPHHVLQVQRMRPSPFNKNSGKPAAAKAAAARPPSNLGQAAAPAAAKPAKAKGKAQVVDSEVSGLGGGAAGKAGLVRWLPRQRSVGRTVGAMGSRSAIPGSTPVACPAFHPAALSLTGRG